MLGNILHDADVEALQQGDTTGKALLKVNLATHGTFGDGANLVTDTVALSQFVDALCLDECGVHIETDKAAHATEHVVALEGEVDLHLVRQFHELGLHLLSVNGLATQREHDASSGMGAVLLNALATCQSDDAVDVQSLVGQDACGSLNLARLQLSTEYHEDVAILALMTYPGFVFVIADGREHDVDAQLGSLEKQFLHGKARLRVVHADEDAEG